jgi:menaquinone-specific isochorismate synthase
VSTASISPIPRIRRALPVSVRTIELSDDAVESLLARLPRAASVSWVTGGEGRSQTGFAGWGVAARYEAIGPERFSRVQRWWAKYAADAEVDDEVQIPGTGPVAFCSFTFDPETAAPSVALVPEVLLARRDGISWLTVVGGDRRSSSALLSDAHADLSRPISVPDVPRNVHYTDGAMSEQSWQRTVDEAVRRIHAGELDKVVLARDVMATATEPIDVRYLLNRLAAEYPSCWTFAVDGLVGATPEMLVRRTGDLVTSRVLAGTVKRSEDASSDASLASALLASAKDHEEHVYAVRSVAAALAAHCTDLQIPSSPSLLRLANVQHLSTDVTGELADGSSVLALAASLHPTAAVCGTPTERALSVIRELEGMDRGRYAGPVGWVDTTGDGEFGIALRCAMVEANTLRLFAGCGIVAGSEAASELAESQAKLLPMQESLGSD